MAWNLEKCPKGRRALALAIRRFSCKRPSGAIPAGHGIDRHAANGDTRCRGCESRRSSRLLTVADFPANPKITSMMRKILSMTGLTDLLLADCVEPSLLVGYEPNENFLSFNHSFTGAAADDVRARAEKLCGMRKQAAIQTSRTCSLTQCTINYQYMDAADAAKHGQ